MKTQKVALCVKKNCLSMKCLTFIIFFTQISLLLIGLVRIQFSLPLSNDQPAQSHLILRRQKQPGGNDSKRSKTKHYTFRT